MEIRTAVEQHLKDQEYLDNRYDIRPIVGIEQPTAQSALLKGAKVELLNRHGTDDLMGDGTVPRPSATPVEFENHQNEIYGAERHASLQNDDDVLFQLNGILTQPAINPADYRSVTTKVGQRLDLVDWATPADPSRCAPSRSATRAACSSRACRTSTRARSCRARRSATRATAGSRPSWAAAGRRLPRDVARRQRRAGHRPLTVVDE